MTKNIDHCIYLCPTYVEIWTWVKALLQAMASSSAEIPLSILQVCQANRLAIKANVPTKDWEILRGIAY